MNDSILHNRKNDMTQFNNILVPAPRPQNQSVPYLGVENPSETQPYSKDSCYLMDNKAQGVVGIVCNQAGGSDNANFIRGNQFGVNFENNKKLSPVQTHMQVTPVVERPWVVYDEQTFYPYPSFPLQKDKDYLTYPREQNFTPEGLPIYHFPYPANPYTDPKIERFENNISSLFQVMLKSRILNFGILILFVLLCIYLLSPKKK
jgi:hypothetical protein